MQFIKRSIILRRANRTLIFAAVNKAAIFSNCTLPTDYGVLYVLVFKRLLQSYLYGVHETKMSTDVCTMSVYQRGSNKVAAETAIESFWSLLMDATLTVL